MPNFLFWPSTSGISIFPELSIIFISPPNFFPEITARAEAAFGDIIPRRIEP